MVYIRFEKIGKEIMHLQGPEFAIDFSENAFTQAIGQLEILPREATIWVPSAAIAPATFVSEKYGCSLIAIPNVLCKSPFCWGVTDNRGSMYWSSGVS